ncbi:MAG: PAS domain S-box protein [Bryobacteraceae bacterium]
MGQRLRVVFTTAILVAVAFALTAAMPSVRRETPFLFLVLAVFTAALLHGFVGGLSVMAAGTVVWAGFIVDMAGYLLELALFCGVALTITWMLERLRRDVAERRRIEAALAKRNQRLLLLEQASRHLLTGDDLRRMVRGLFDIVSGHLRVDVYFNFMVNEAGDALRMESCAGVSEEIARSISRLEFGQAVCGAVARDRCPLVVDAIQSSEDPRVQLVRGLGIRTYACNPLFAGERLLGTLSFGSRLRDSFEPDELEFMQTIAHYVELAMERVELNNALRRSNRTLDAVVRHSPLPIWTADLSGAVQLWNPAAERVFGWTANEVRGRRAPMIPEEIAPLFHQWLARVAAGETLIGLESQRRRKDGSTFLASTSMSPLRDSEDAITGVLAITADVTEQKRLEEQLRETQKLESIGLLAGGIAHDFNNLLVGIVGGASLAMEMASGQEQTNILGDVLRSGERAADLTRQLLAYAGKARMTAGQFDLKQVLEETVNIVQATVPKRVRINLEAGSGGPVIDGDRTQVQQLVLNLVLNAAEATEGSPDPCVTVTAGGIGPEDCAAMGFQTDSARAYAYLSVRDNGCGMDEDTRKRIFDPFFTTKFHGRGLGLAAVSGILRAHNGQIRVESALGAGTTFVVLLPAVDGERTRAEPAPPPASLRGHETILVVDDDPAVRSFANSCLLHHGYRVLLARDGEECIGLLEHHGGEIALIILDLTMPGIGGEHTLRMIRARAPHMPVILSSGHSETEARARFGDAGAAYLQKPYKTLQLASKLREVLGTREAARV